MDLAVLDLRHNQISNFKVAQKYLKHTVILGWDNPITEKTIDGVINKPKILESNKGTSSTNTNSTGGFGTEFNPFLLLKGNEQQRRLVENI